MGGGLRMYVQVLLNWCFRYPRRYVLFNYAGSHIFCWLCFGSVLRFRSTNTPMSSPVHSLCLVPSHVFVMWP